MSTCHILHIALSVAHVYYLCMYLSTCRLPTSGGVTSVSFYDGRARFTRLRINEPSAGVTLQFITNPKNLVVTSSVFTVVSPSADTVRQRVHFQLTGNVATVANSKSSFAEVVQSSLAAYLDIDVSRVQNVEV